MQAGRKLAPAYLFIGCHHPSHDALFSEELRKWEVEGVVKLFYAYSKKQEESEDCKHVQDRLWAEREEMKGVFEDGAKLYVCGSARVGEGVKEVTKGIYKEAALARGKEKSEQDIEEWFKGIMGERFASDVFA